MFFKALYSTSNFKMAISIYHSLGNIMGLGFRVLTHKEMSQKIDYELQQWLKEIKWLRNKCLQNADFVSGQAGGSPCLQLG